MDMAMATSVISGLLAVIALLVIVVKWVMESNSKKSNGSVSSTTGPASVPPQCRECYEQHLELKSDLKVLLVTLQDVKSILVGRGAIFDRIMDAIAQVERDIKP